MTTEPKTGLPLDLIGKVEAASLISNLRPKVAGVDFAWKTLYHAEKYINSQIAAYFAPEAA